MGVYFDVGPSPDNKIDSVGTSIGSSCANDCIFPSTLQEPTESPLVLDAYGSATTYGNFQTGPVGDGFITYSAGAGSVQVKVHVYHCTYRPTCG